MLIDTETMSSVVRSLVGLAKQAEAIAALELLASLPVTDAQRVCEVDETAAHLGSHRGYVVYWFKQLASAGCGRFIVGRKGHRSRFEWWFAPTSVYDAALKRRTDLDTLVVTNDGHVTEDGDELADETAEEDDRGTDQAPKDGADTNIEHTFMLRPGLPVRLILPESLTKIEAERLSAFIRTLPFG